jgi:antirestriction protein ArdC
MTQDRTDVYTRITAEIIAAIEAGAGEFKMPWHHTGTSIARPTNVASSKGYRGVNVLALWVAAEIADYDSGLWGTYRQWLAREAQVRKGEHGTTVVLWKQADAPSDDDRAGDEESSPRRIFARAFTVFNVRQVDGYQPEPVALLPESERVAHAEAFIGNLGITTVFGSPNAYYQPATDTVHMPDFGYFHEAA